MHHVLVYHEESFQRNRPNEYTWKINQNYIYMMKKRVVSHVIWYIHKELEMQNLQCWYVLYVFIESRTVTFRVVLSNRWWRNWWYHTILAWYHRFPHYLWGGTTLKVPVRSSSIIWSRFRHWKFGISSSFYTYHITCDTTRFFIICEVVPPGKYLYVVHQSYGVGISIASLASLVPSVHTI